jgi:hypothetical protein
MIIDLENRTRLQRALEDRLAEIGEGEGKNFLLIMLSLIYDLEEAEFRRQARQRHRQPEGGSSPATEDPRIMEENRRLKALLDVLLARVRFSAPGASETAH